MQKLKLFIFSIMVSTVCLAVGTSAQVSWSPPTAYIDGTVLPVTDIAFYTISFSGQTLKVDAPAVSATVPVPCGSTSFAVDVTTTATAHYPNVTSGMSSSVPYATGVACVPNPPSGVAAH